MSLSEVELLEAKLGETRAQLRDLATMGAVVTRIQEIDAVLSVAMDMALRLVAGEVGTIMISEKDCLQTKISWGVDGDFVRSLKYEEGLDLATYAYERRQAVILTDLGIRSDEGININTVIALPISTMDQTLGVIVIINKSDGSQFDSHDRETLEMLLSFIAVAIDNSHLVKEKLSRQKIEQEMAIAKQIQETILPQVGEKFQGAEIGAVYFPAREVGGDFYDILRIDDNRFLVVLGDVSNKGVPAALVMSACSGIIKSTVASDPEIEVNQLIAKVNTVLSEQIIKDRDMFVTLFMARFDLAEMKMSYSNGGHIPGLFWGSSSGKIEELSDGGPIVGQFAGIPFKKGERALVSGDRLFLFTDGLTEAEDVHGNMFGRERVEQVFGTEIGLHPKEFCLKVKEWVDRFSAGAPEDSHDDFTIMQIKVE